jgi:hypothetical protein
VYSTVPESALVWRAPATIAGARYPNLAIVGQELEGDPSRAKAAGFTGACPLHIWVK